MVDKQLRLIFDDLDGVLEDTVKRVSLAVTAELQRATPVDVGWARANWVPSISVAFSGLRTPEDDRKKKELLSTALSAQAAGIARVATSYKINMGSIFVTNNVPYIIELDQGSSQQAPSGFVRGAVVRAARR